MSLQIAARDADRSPRRSSLDQAARITVDVPERSSRPEF